jgi:hypothetical protein
MTYFSRSHNGQSHDKGPDTLAPLTRVRYLNNDGQYTGRGRVIDPAFGAGCYCDCGIDCQDQRHEAYYVKWDNKTKSIVARCHLTTNPERIGD